MAFKEVFSDTSRGQKDGQSKPSFNIYTSVHCPSHIIGFSCVQLATNNVSNYYLWDKMVSDVLWDFHWKTGNSLVAKAVHS